MERLEGILPGISKYLKETLANERLSVAAEQQRRHFVDLLDVLNLRTPPRVPAPLPSTEAASSRAPAPLPPGHSKQNAAQDSMPPWKSADLQHATSRAAAQESVYNDVTDETDGSPAAAAVRKRSSDEDSVIDLYEGYEEPLSILSPANKQNAPAADNTGGGTTEDSGTDYEEYSGDDDADYEDGELPLAGVSTEAETIQLPRVKSKKKKKGSPADCLKPYDALTSRQYEGEAYVRRNMSWSRFYCVLALDALHCYKSTVDLQPRVFMPLSGHDVLLMEKEKGRNNVLRISKPGTETLFLSFDTIERANEWFKQLNIALAKPDNRTSVDEKMATTFYCIYDEFGSAAAAGATRIEPQISQHTNDDGDNRPYSPGPTGPSGAATLPIMTSPTSKGFVQESATVPKAAPRKAPANDGKMKGRITKLFTGTGGKKKGRVTMDLMQDYSSKRLSTDPDIVISGMLAVSSRHFASGGRRWEEARCVIRVGGTFECHLLSGFEAGDAALSSAADPDISLCLSECTMEPSSDKERPLAMRLIRAGGLELTFMPCDRLDHGCWLAALCKYVDRGTKVANAGPASAGLAANGQGSSSSSPSGSGDGVIQHNAYVNFKPSAAADSAAADAPKSADVTPTAGNPPVSTPMSPTLLSPIYINVDGGATKSASAAVTPAREDENCLEVAEALRNHRPSQQAGSRKSAEVSGSASASAAPVTAAGGRPGAASAAGSSAPVSSASSNGAAAGNPEQQQASPTSDEGRGGSAEESSVSVLVRVLNAESMSKSSGSLTAAVRPRETTPPTAAAAPAAATVTAERLLRSATQPAAFGAPTARQTPAAAAGAPVSPLSHPPTSGVSVSSAAAANELTGEFAPKKLTVSGGIARNRALFEASPASTAAAASVTSGTLTARPANTTPAPETRWSGYKLAVAPAVATGSTAPGLGHARRRSSSELEVSPVLPSGGGGNMTWSAAPGPAVAVHGQGSLAKAGGGVRGIVTASVATVSLSLSHQAPAPRQPLDTAASNRPSAAATLKVPPTAATLTTATATTTAAATATATAAVPLGSSAMHCKSASLPVDGSEGCALPLVDSRVAAAASDGSSPKVDITVRKTEAKLFLGSLVGKLVAPAAVSATSGERSAVASAATVPSSASAPSAVADVRPENADACGKQQLEQQRLHLAELRKQRNQVRTQKAGAATVAERSRLELEYRSLDDRCRELERLIHDQEDANLMHIKDKPNAV